MGLLFLNWWGEWFHCLRSLSFSFIFFFFLSSHQGYPYKHRLIYVSSKGCHFTYEKGSLTLALQGSKLSSSIIMMLSFSGNKIASPVLWMVHSTFLNKCMNALGLNKLWNLPWKSECSVSMHTACGGAETPVSHTSTIQYPACTLHCASSPFYNFLGDDSSGKNNALSDFW